MNRILFATITLLFFNSAFTLKAADGVVFNDSNGNGLRDKGEAGLSGIAVSNGKEVVQTDKQGKWSLPHDEDTIFFVVKPSGWAVPVDDQQLPRFYYIHKPGGSPTHFKYKGVSPTGKIPDSIDFALTKSKEPEKFRAIFFGDPQPNSIEEVGYIAHDVISELIGTDAKFGVTLGDIMFDHLDLFEPSNANVALIGIPWYNVIGNHDINKEAELDSDSDETFHRYFGPAYYSFDYGQVHFIVLDDVDYGSHHEADKKTYKGGFGPDQIEFVKNDLAVVSKEKLVCLIMHIPLIDVGNRQELYRLIEKRPYSMSISGHTHWHAHKYIGEEDGWHGEKPHHHIINVTVSGSWWKGLKDEYGVPHAMMRDGAPNGYSIINFDGPNHTLDFKVAGRPAEFQMSIHAPDQVKVEAANKTPVYVNLFNGSAKSVVKMRLGPDQKWRVMAKVLENDPYYVKMEAGEEELFPGRRPKHSRPVPSDHLWKLNLPKGNRSGSYLIEIDATGAYGRPHKSQRVIRLVD